MTSCARSMNASVWPRPRRKVATAASSVSGSSVASSAMTTTLSVAASYIAPIAPMTQIGSIGSTSATIDYDGEEDEYLPVPGPRNAERLDTFGSLDFRISREFPVRHGKLTGFIEVTNATNRKNVCCIDFDLDEDDDGNVFLDAVSDQWLPAIPAIGILWEF